MEPSKDGIKSKVNVMVVGLVFMGIIAGLGAAVTSLIFGFSVLSAILIYILAANLSVFTVIGLGVIRHTMGGGLSPAPVRH